MRSVAIAAVAVLITVAPARGESGADEAAFAAAADLMADESFAEAAEAFVTLADAHPDSRFSDDALFSAAKLFEERLGDPTRAAATYERIVRDYPNSRVALASSRRLELLRADLGPSGEGADAVARFNDIRQNAAERGDLASIELMEALVDEQLEWPGQARALLWLAAAYDRTDDHDRAFATYLRSAEIASDSVVVFDAYSGAGELALRLGRYDEAERHFRLMPIDGDPSRQRSYDAALRRVDREQLRSRLYVVSFAIIAFVVLAFAISLWLATASFGAAARALARPPVEAVYMLPIAALLIGASYTGHDQIGPAVTMICAGGILITWLSGATLAAAKSHHRLRPMLHVAASAVGEAARRQCWCCEATERPGW